MARTALALLLSILLTSCASPVRQLFRSRAWHYPVNIEPVSATTPMLTDLNVDPPTRPAPEHRQFFTSGVDHLESLATIRRLRQFAPAEAFTLESPYLWQLSPGPDFLCIAIPFSAFQIVSPQGQDHTEYHVETHHHLVGRHSVLETRNILLLCADGDHWKLTCCSM